MITTLIQNITQMRKKNAQISNKRERDPFREPLYVSPNRLSSIPLDIKGITNRMSIGRPSRYTLNNSVQNSRFIDNTEYEVIEEEFII